MKLANLGAIAILAVSLTTAHASGQVFSFKADVPFPFVVGKQTLPAATYVVQRFLGKPRTPDDVGVIVMKASSHHIYKVIVTAPGEAHPAVRAGGSRLIFTSFKGKQYLNCIWVAGDAVAHQLPAVADNAAVPSSAGEVIVTAIRYSRGK